MLVRLALVALVALLVGVAGASAQEPEPTVVSKERKVPPERVERKKRFEPDAELYGYAEVSRVAALERARWGGPSIMGRIGCETGHIYNSNATNGQYLGLLQIGGWWGHAWPRTPRTVRLADKDKIKRPVRVILTYSDGSREVREDGFRFVKRVRIKKGRLPGGASPYHGWAAIRVGQRAVSGDGPSTYWECGL